MTAFIYVFNTDYLEHQDPKCQMVERVRHTLSDALSRPIAFGSACRYFLLRAALPTQYPPSCVVVRGDRESNPVV